MRLVEQIFTEVSACDGAAARDALLRTRCRDDSQLLSEVRTLLECAAEGDGVLDQSAPKLVDMPIPGEDASLLPAGTRVGAYIIRSVLGIGGMGVVYLGEQARPNRTVALKVIRPGFATQNVLKRFEYEAELLGRLQHPGIAQIIEAGAAQTPFGMQPFFAMELVHGVPLTTFARDHKLPVRDKIELMVRVCDAVEHAHQRGVVHRDLKPANILVTAQGQPKILDFGVARATGGREAEHRLTLMRTGERQLVGTLAYMSPEQVSGDASAIDTRSDVYALGVVLFELLSGTTPYELDKRSLPDAVRIIRDDDPRSLASVAPSCGRDLEIIAGQTLAKAPAKRYQSAASLAADLRRYLDDVPIQARAPSIADHVLKFARRNTGVFAGALVAILAIAAGAVFGAVQYSQAVIARGLAEERAREAGRQEAKAIQERDAKERETANLRNTLKFTQDYVFAKSYETNPDQGRAVSVVDALRLAQTDMAGRFKTDRLSEARLRFYSSLIFMSNNELDSALLAAARAVELFAEMGEDHFEERRPVEQHLIRLLSQLGRFEEGDRRARDLVAKVRDRNPTNDLGAQATLFVETGRFDLAEPVLREQFTSVLDDPRITPLNTYVQTRRLGALLALLGRMDECESHWNERIAACKAHFGGGDEQAATSQFIGTCAEQFEEVGEFQRALPYRRRVYASLPPEQWLARNMSGPFLLAATLRSLRDPAATIEAVELTGAILAHTRETYGVRSTQLHQATASHIRSLIAAGRTGEGIELGQTALTTLHHESGDWEYRVSDVREAAAEAMLAAGRAPESIELVKAEFARRARIRGRTHPLTLESLRLLGRAMGKAGRAQEIGALCNQTVNDQLQLASMPSQATLTLVQACVDTLLEAGEWGAAEGLARRALSAKLADPGFIRKPMVDLRCAVATAVAQSRGKAPARVELEEFATHVRSLLGNEHPWSRRLNDVLSGPLGGG